MVIHRPSQSAHARSYSESDMFSKNALGLDLESRSPKTAAMHGPFRVRGRWRDVRSSRLFLIAFVSFLSGLLWWTKHTDQLLRRSRQVVTAVAAERHRGFKILHLIDVETHESVMDRWYQRSHAAFSSHAQVGEAQYWGPGFEGYANNMSLVDNVKARFGSADYFDAVLPYWNKDQTVHLQIDSMPWFAEIEALSGHGSIIIDRAHEMRDLRRAELYRLANVTLVLSPYAHELWDYRDEFETRALLVHQPHAVDVETFFAPVDRPRTTEVYLAGSLEEIIYPLRARLGRMIESAELPGYVRAHPGYPDIQSKETRSARNISADWLDDQIIDYANELKEAKICLVTTSRFLYSVQKFGEAALAGCLIMGNIPADRRDAFSEFVVPINMETTNDEIATTVQQWLDDDHARKAKAELGQRYFAEHFSSDNYVQEVIRWVGLVQSGQRGLVLPHAWSFLPPDLPWDG